MNSDSECDDAWITPSSFVPLGSQKLRHRSRASRPPCEPAEERFFTIEAIAECLGVCTRTVRRWIKKRLLIAHRFNGILRISESDFRAFLAAHRDH
jgi:excisionase family DNA binding protein